MARTQLSVDDLPSPLPPLIALVGDEELLIARAISAIAAAARRADPLTAESDIEGAQLQGPELHEMLGPSLFSDARLVIVRGAQDVKAAVQPVLSQYLTAPGAGTVIVMQHAGAAKGKAVLEAARKAGAAEIPVAKLTKATERLAFVRAEVRRAGGQINAEAATALLESVGNELRELAAAATQLAADASGPVDVELVRRFHQGKAAVSGYNVADLAVVGNVPGALEALRYALQLGVPHVVIADAMADGVRSIAKVASAGRGNKFDLASRLGMPAWKIERAQSQLRGWSEPGVRQAFAVVARLNADVKGAAANADYALERAVHDLAQARSLPR